ncbi:hypothetical protein, partial [Pseudomonas lini]|uniref:hypothetical protein n=1 Tax=Pseudomonas lini TaxID=163011 RepID=UPI0027D8D753
TIASKLAPTMDRVVRKSWVHNRSTVGASLLAKAISLAPDDLDQTRLQGATAGCDLLIFA